MQTWRADVWTWGVGEDRVGRRERRADITTCEIDSGGTGSSVRVLCDDLQGEGVSRARGCVYTYGRFTLAWGRDQRSIVKQLSSN